MTRPRFGTDGVRGVANVELTPELAISIGRAAACVLGAPAFVVGRDTRQSGPMLQAALSAGLAAEGVDVADLGVLPTAGVAWCAERRGVPAAVVSASHNPFSDNGIKLFDARGVKLPPAVEDSIEEVVGDLVGDDALPASRSRPAGRAAPSPAPPVVPAPPAVPGRSDRVGRIAPDPGAVEGYRHHLVSSLDGRRLDGLSVVVDCANGAASEVGPAALGALGATVTVVASSPDGTNINAGCGSTDPGPLAAVVRGTGADLGLAVDGDADRLVAVDHTGAVLDGDALLALFALDLKERGELDGGAVAVTVMTNLGFRLAMTRHGVGVVETQVGDRQVLAAIDEAGLALGGEQSGHIVFRRRASTGDGVLTGLLLADLVLRSGRPLAALAGGLVERVPQVLRNVGAPDPGRLGACDAVWQAVADAQAELGEEGRVLLRPSGTEPVVRVMVEAPTDGLAAEVADRLAKVVVAALGDR